MIRFNKFMTTTLAMTLALTASGARAESLDKIDDAAPQLIESPDHSSSWPQSLSGVVTDTSGQALADASLVLNGIEIKTNSRGEFSMNGGSSADLIVKKAGYRKLILKPRSGEPNIQLAPQVINGVYVQAGILKNKNSATMLNIMELIRVTELNAMVVDVKDDDGRVTQGLAPYVAQLHAQGVYMIARIVTFKDNIAARQHPELAITDRGTGRPWQDHKGITYLNPFNEGAHQYVINIAKKAVEAGFDEIEFDYVRFPTDGNRNNAVWPEAFTPDSRTGAISGFLKEARTELGAMGAFIAADVFGDTAYVKTDSGIGQRIEDITRYLDYVCPMIYPSGFGKGTAGYAVPVDHPKEIIEDSVRRYRLRADKDTVIRPWLQAFRDYAFNHRDYGSYEISAQIQGSDDVGGEGFLLWNAASRYTSAGLQKKSSRSDYRHSSKVVIK